MINNIKINKQGFIMTILIISLPLFITCIMILTALIFCIRNYNLTQKICIQHTLQAQQQIKKSLQKLFILNPVAKYLRKSQKHLERLSRIATIPIVVTALRLKIHIIKSKRLILDKKQKRILYNTKKIVETYFRSFKKELKKFNPRNISKTHYKPIPLAVTHKPYGSIAPTYYTKSRFSTHQTLSFYWKMPLYRFLPFWIKDHFFFNTFSSYNCAATIKKIKLKWKSTLSYHRRNAYLNTIRKK